jgi:hypothetical protein
MSRLGQVFCNLVEEYAAVAFGSPCAGGGEKGVVAIAAVAPLGQELRKDGRIMGTRPEIQDGAVHWGEGYNAGLDKMLEVFNIAFGFFRIVVKQVSLHCGFAAREKAGIQEDKAAGGAAPIIGQPCRFGGVK